MAKRVKKPTMAESAPIETDPYSILCEPVVCSKQDHARKKNCKDNPWCTFGMEDKEGIWAKIPTILSSLGCDPSLNLRRPSPSNPSIKVPPGGLINLGATCYLNVLIQSLYHNGLIRDAVFNMTPNLESTNEEQKLLTEVFLALQKAFTYLELSDNGVYDLRGFVDLLGLSKGVQQDPQEFNKLFFSKIEALQLPLQDNRRSDIKSLISGTENYSIVCTGCNADSNADHPFHELDLSVEGHKTLESAIEGYLQKELLTGDNSYECRQCGGLRDAIRCTKIVAPPTVLYIQLLRYTYDKTTFEKKKLRTDVAYPKILTFHEEEYVLVAVLFHKGRSAYGGHYVCDVLDWDSNTWWHCDDSVVSKTTCPADDFVGSSSEAAIDLDNASTLSSEDKNVFVLNESDDSYKQADENKPQKKRKSGTSGSGATPKKRAKKESDDEDDPEVALVGKSSTSEEVKTGESAKNLYLSRRKDAYMLSYVKRSAFESRVAEGGVLPAQVFVDEVTASSMEFRDKIAEFNRNKAVVEAAIADRKSAYESIVDSFVPELRHGSHNLPDCHFVPSQWLSRWINGHPSTFSGLPSSVVAASLAASASSSSSESESQDLMKCQRCVHGAGVKLSDLKKFKVLSDEAYVKITTNGDHPQDVSHDFTSLNYRCQQCYDTHLESTSANHALNKKIQKLISVIADAEMKPETENCTRLIAKSWITLLRKHSESLSNLLKGTGKKAAQEVLANLSSGDSPSILKMIEEIKQQKTSGGSSSSNDDLKAAATAAAEEELDQRIIVDLVNDDAGLATGEGRTASSAMDVCEVFQSSKNRLDPLVNSVLFCPHNALTNAKRALAVPLETWQLVLELYPFAEEVRKNQPQCEVCQLISSEALETVHKKKQQRVDELTNFPSLAGLNKMKKIFPKEFGGESIFDPEGEGWDSKTYCLVDGKWLAQWRHYLKQNDFPRPDLALIQSRLQCKHGMALMPEMFRKIPEGLLPVHFESGKVSVCTSDECFDSSGAPVVELISEDQFMALHKAADIPGDGDSTYFGSEAEEEARIPVPAVRLTWRKDHWDWSRQHCEECFQNLQMTLKNNNMVFRNKKISVKMYTDESKLALVISMPAANNSTSTVGGGAAVADPNSEAPTRKSSRRSTAACKSYSVSLNSDDTISMVKLKLFQDCMDEGSPNSLKLFNQQGVEMSKSNATLASYELQCTDTLYALIKQCEEYVDFGDFAADLFSSHRGSKTAEEGFAGSLLSGLRSGPAVKSNGSVGSGGSATNVFELLDDSQDGFKSDEQIYEEQMAMAMKNSLSS